MSAFGTRSTAKPLDDGEQRYAYAGAGFGGAVTLGLWVPNLDVRGGIGALGAGLVMAAFLALAAKSRKRLATGLAAVLLAFGPWGISWVVGLPYLVLAAFLALKSSRLQPGAAPEVGEHGETVPPAVDRPAKESRPRKPSRRRRRGADDTDHDALAGAGPASRKPPPPSKRYTPPTRRP